MSFEGFYQVACENKHYSTIDCYMFSRSSSKCEHCGGSIVRSQLIDQTNGMEDGDQERMDSFKEGLIYPVTIMSDQLERIKQDVLTATEWVDRLVAYVPQRSAVRWDAESFRDKLKREYKL